MKISVKNSKARKFQMGGAVEQAPEQEQAPVEGAPEEAAPEEQGGGQDPLMQVAQLAAQALQNQDCQAAMQVCQVFLQLVQQAQGGGQEQPQGEPVYRKGGVLVRRIKK
jgi:hypothetical protein